MVSHPGSSGLLAPPPPYSSAAASGAVTSAVTRGYSTALRLYDLTGGWRIGARHKKVTRAQALARMPALDTQRLAAGFIYLDARGDDVNHAAVRIAHIRDRLAE